MLNLTARLAIRMQNLPDWDFDWSCTSPQRSRSSLTSEDFLPSADDGVQLKERAVLYMMETLVNEFPTLSHLKKFVPPRKSPHPTLKAEVVPMKILFHDEKYKAENIEILTDFMNTADLQGDKQVCKFV